MAENDFLTFGLALLALLVSVVSVIVSTRYQKKEREVQLSAYVENTVEALRDWSARTIHALSEAVFLCDIDPTRREGGNIFEERRRAMEKISALWDEGRFYLPSSMRPDPKGGPDAKVRVQALILLNDAYELVRELSYTDKGHNLVVRPKLVECKRAFVGELQDLLDARLRKQLFDQFSSELRRSAKIDLK
jgi:hypothetical protein